jgi:hypothetical protein
MKELNMFLEFAREAMEDGDSNAAVLFDSASLDRAECCCRFQVILEQMDLDRVVGM